MIATNILTDKEREILNIIECATNSKYLGKLKLCFDETIDSYVLYLYLNREMTPLMLSKQGSWEEFLDFLQQEFLTRRLQEIASWDCKQVDKSTNI